MEEWTDGSLILLIFDPGCRQMKKFQTSTDISWLMHLVRRDVDSLKAQQYQILSVNGLVSDKQDYNVSVKLPLLILSLSSCVKGSNCMLTGCFTRPLYNVHL